MLDKLFHKPLTLTIGDQTMQFTSVADMSFALEGRTSISANKLGELFKMSTEELDKQANKLSELNKSMFDILNEVVDAPENVDRAMRELDSQMFSQDQGWREIIQALNKIEGENNAIRVTVIMKYMKYLGALEETLNYIRAERHKKKGEDFTSEHKMSAFETTWSLGQLREGVKAAEAEQTDLPEEEFQRLPKEKQVSITLPPGKRIDIKLATYPCQLVATDNDIRLVNDHGESTLKKGSNIIGRSVKSTVQIDAAQKHVSRTHLVILHEEGNALHLTDHSSEGTFIRSAALG